MPKITARAVLLLCFVVAACEPRSVPPTPKTADSHVQRGSAFSARSIAGAPSSAVSGMGDRSSERALGLIVMA
jgi:hypothetical protein